LGLAALCFFEAGMADMNLFSPTGPVPAGYSGGIGGRVGEVKGVMAPQTKNFDIFRVAHRQSLDIVFK
jgi:hypothetical protein